MTVTVEGFATRHRSTSPSWLSIRVRQPPSAPRDRRSMRRADDSVGPGPAGRDSGPGQARSPAANLRFSDGNSRSRSARRSGSTPTATAASVISIAARRICFDGARRRKPKTRSNARSGSSRTTRLGELDPRHRIEIGRIHRQFQRNGPAHPHHPPNPRRERRPAPLLGAAAVGPLDARPPSEPDPSDRRAPSLQPPGGTGLRRGQPAQQ